MIEKTRRLKQLGGVLCLNLGYYYRGEFAAPALVEFYGAFRFCVKGVVAAAADIDPRVNFCPPLADND